MLKNVKEKFIDKSINSLMIDNEIKNLFESNETENIKEDIELLKQMGFDNKMINKVYILLRPENIQSAIDYMTEINGIYQHNFIVNKNRKEKDLCFICKRPKHNHLDFNSSYLIGETQDNKLINNEQEIIDVDENIIKENNNNFIECEVCYEDVKTVEKN